MATMTNPFDRASDPLRHELARRIASISPAPGKTIGLDEEKLRHTAVETIRVLSNWVDNPHPSFLAWLAGSNALPDTFFAMVPRSLTDEELSKFTVRRYPEGISGRHDMVRCIPERVCFVPSYYSGGQSLYLYAMPNAKSFAAFDAQATRFHAFQQPSPLVSLPTAPRPPAPSPAPETPRSMVAAAQATASSAAARKAPVPVPVAVPGRTPPGERDRVKSILLSQMLSTPLTNDETVSMSDSEITRATIGWSEALQTWGYSFGDLIDLLRRDNRLPRFAIVLLPNMMSEDDLSSLALRAPIGRVARPQLLTDIDLSDDGSEESYAPRPMHLYVVPTVDVLKALQSVESLHDCTCQPSFTKKSIPLYNSSKMLSAFFSRSFL